VQALSAGTTHACATLKTGALKCWGANADGQLGNGATVASAVPVAVTGVTRVVDVEGGLGHTCARIPSSGIMCWGRNEAGQLGDGSTASRATPLAAGSLSNRVEMVGPVAGHVMPVAWSMAKSSTATQSLIVTYDPLAVAAAVLIEQYARHVAACNATT